jgi:ABC-type branched-subunit amino acid transport system substrate-binding protein
MATEERHNPYVGPRPFEREDANRFFGRAREIRDVVSLIVAQRVLLLYSASGAGKTSLMKAGVLPVLEEEKGFDVLPVARLRSGDPPQDRNVFTFGLLSSIGKEQPRSSSLGQLLEQRPKRANASLRALVIDQFEELFTAYPERWHERAGLFEDLRQASDADPGLRIVLATREDFLAQLDPFTLLLPGGLRTRFRLERLNRASALAAVKGPIAETGRTFAAGAAEALIADLLQFQVETDSGNRADVEGEFVEPVQLQVTCRNLWNELPPDVNEITTEHLRIFGNVDQVLAEFYDDSVRAAAAASKLPERRLRRLIEDELITSVGTRGTAYRTGETTGKIPNAAIDELESKHLVRAEIRAYARWYELTHDRLIKPIRTSNERHFASLARTRRRRVLWAVGVLPVLAVIVALALLRPSNGSTVRRAEVSAPTLIASRAYHDPTSFTVLSQVSLSANRSSALLLQFSEHDADTGSNLPLQSTSTIPIAAKKAGDYPIRVLLRTPTGVGRFFVSAELLDRNRNVLDRAQGSTLQVTPGRRVIALPSSQTSSRTFATFEVTKSGAGTVTSSPPKIRCGTSCSATYTVGQRLTLGAVPAAGARFKGWQGGCTGRLPQCEVRVGAVTAVHASFVTLEVQSIASPYCRPITYGGQGPVDALIASDLPLSGARAPEMAAASQAIEATIAKNGWRAGRHNVAYQACDDGSTQRGAKHSTKCRGNARAYANDRNVVAVIGPFDNGCAEQQLPQLNDHTGERVALVSPGVSELCLTIRSRLCNMSSAIRYHTWPNFVRLSPHGAIEATALAEFAKQRGIKCAGVVDDGSPYGATMARLLNIAARNLGILCSAGSWSNPTLMQGLKSKHVDAVFLAGQAGSSAAQVIKDKVAVLGPNNGQVKLFAPSNFATANLIRATGKGNAAAGMFVSSIFPDAFSAKARNALRHLGITRLYSTTAYATQAAELVLAAVTEGGADRGGVIRALHNATPKDGILGPLRVDQHGDVSPVRSGQTSASTTTSIRIVIASGRTFKNVTVIRPLSCLVRFAIISPVEVTEAARRCANTLPLK